MRFRWIRMIQFILLGLLLVLFIGGQMYKASAPISHIPWLFPLGELLCGGAMIFLDRKNKCPHCGKDLGYKRQEQCPHCKEPLI